MKTGEQTYISVVPISESDSDFESDRMTDVRTMAPSNIKLNPIGVGLVILLTLIILYASGFAKNFMFGANAGGSQVNLKELLSAGIDVVRKGGDKVRIIRESMPLDAETKGLTKEGATELKTNGDMASHIQMYHGLKAAFPNVDVQSEEHEEIPVDSKSIPAANRFLTEIQSLDSSISVAAEDITIWIDPLDATQEYTEDLRQYVTTMMCVAVKGVPTIGVIYKPFSDTTYWGWVDQAHSTTLMTKDTPETTKIIVSRSHSGQVEEIAKKALGDNIEIVPAGGAGYKTLEVIAGNASAYVHVTAIKKWDLCAGNAIIKSFDVDHKEFQGMMTTLEGRNIDYSGAGSPLSEDGLLATIHDHEKFLTILRPGFEELKKSG